MCPGTGCPPVEGFEATTIDADVPLSGPTLFAASTAWTRYVWLEPAIKPEWVNEVLVVVPIWLLVAPTTSKTR